MCIELREKANEDPTFIFYLMVHGTNLYQNNTAPNTVCCLRKMCCTRLINMFDMYSMHYKAKPSLVPAVLTAVTITSTIF
jgi:hypothetical protein